VSELLGLGVSHKTAPVELRERLSLPTGRSEDFLRDLRGDPEVQEAVAISTCNRTEVYVVAGDPVEAETVVLGALARRAGIRPTELAGSMYALRNCDAARHLFRVAAGLESMVVGEAEVQGQVRRAWDDARATGASGLLTDHLFGAALAAGRRVRAETAIARGHASISSVAVALAREVLGGLEGRSAVLLGAGETSELTARALSEQGVEAIFVANRRQQRALALARRFGGQAAGLDELPERLERADILVSATSSPHPIVGAAEIAEVMRARRGRRLLLVDLAVPRDIEPDCGAVEGVALHDVDDLQAVVARNRSVRQAEARRAEGLVEEEIQRFAAWLGALDVQPTLASLRQKAETIAQEIVAENAGHWEQLTDADRDRVEALARAIVNRLLHEPTLRLKAAGDDHAHLRTQVVRELFGLDDPEELAEVHVLRRRARP
jgi:glutamyl-tRNA reductase